MEKYSKQHQETSFPQITSTRRSHCYRIAATFVLVGLCLYISSLSRVDDAHGHTVPESASDMEFDWLQIQPSEAIQWTKCHGHHQCARLELPLDYARPDGPKTVIALRMIPSNDTRNYKGTILINPGGPGGSGVEIVGAYGDAFAKIIGPQFDILGFDPRGVGASTPAAKCFSSESEQKIWNLQSGPLVTNTSSKRMIAYARSRQSLNAELCKVIIGGNGAEKLNGSAEDWGIGRYMSTASVATDMLRITEKLGQEKLKYWGFSYGSVLGQYFAAMYPHKVGRLIIDGVFDATNYRSSFWTSNLVDTDAIYESIFEFCHAAGASLCPIYESTVEKTRARGHRITQNLSEFPIALPFTSKGPQIFTSKDLFTYTFAALYSPLKKFKVVTDVLQAIENQNNTALLELVESHFDVGLRCNCTQNRLPWLSDMTDALAAIACGDADKLPDSPGQYEAWLSQITALSSFGAPALSDLFLRCSEWKIRPKWRYTGPLSTNASFSDSPIFIISPKLDPVCPLSDAQRVQKRYGGSRLLVQNSTGHCSISAPSLCTARAVRAYFQEGVLPKEGEICQPDELPFIGKIVRAEVMSQDDEEMLRALHELSEAVPHFRLGNI